MAASGTLPPLYRRSKSLTFSNSINQLSSSAALQITVNPACRSTLALRFVSRPNSRRNRVNLSLSINGTKYEADVEPRLLLVHFIRDLAGLTGTHIGCETSICGACTVMLNGQTVKS